MKEIPEDPDLLLKAINENVELNGLELAGFSRGQVRGKTMKVSLMEVRRSLVKQFLDVGKALDTGSAIELKKALADLRNVAGCMFLIVQRDEKEFST